MSRKALSYLLLVLIAWQSLSAMADVHPVNSAKAAPFSTAFADGTSAGLQEDSTATDLINQTPLLDDLFHCHHHGCHGHFYLSGDLTISDFFHSDLFYNDNRSIFPLAPLSLLYRPPIA